jgi:hypothetical protein
LLFLSCLLFLTLVLILFTASISHCVTPFSLHLSFRNENYDHTADSGTNYFPGAEN